MARKQLLKSSEDLNIKPKLSEKINFKSRRFKFSERQKAANILINFIEELYPYLIKYL